MDINSQKAKVLKIMIQAADPTRWFRAHVFAEEKGKNFIGYEAPARFCELRLRYPEMIEIQDRATVTSNCTILAHDLSMRYIDNTETVGEVVIGKGAFIGMNTIILPGVVIGENCIIGCGSVVTKDTEPNSIYVGVPAKLIKRLSPQKQ